jgi:hypothetical protein
MDAGSQVRHATALVVRIGIWLRDEETAPTDDVRWEPEREPTQSGSTRLGAICPDVQSAAPEHVFAREGSPFNSRGLCQTSPGICQEG